MLINDAIFLKKSVMPKMNFKNCLQPSKCIMINAILLFLMSCEVIRPSGSDRLIARAENDYLYLSDIERQFESFNSKEDSLIKVNNFIDNWARQKLLYEKSLINLPQDKISELMDLVNNYESSLFRNAYKEFVLKSSMDTLMNQSLNKAYYERNKQNFMLKQPIYRIRHISLPLDNVDRGEITNRFKRFDTEDIVFLDSLSFQFSNYFLADSLWLNQVEIVKQLNFLNLNERSRFLKSPNYFEIEDSLALYLCQLVDRLDRGNVAPFTYVENTIRDIVLNKRKIEFLRSFDTDILQDAIKIKKFEKY